MQEPGEWNASEDDGICAVMWCDANDENKKLTLYTTTPHVQTLHHQDSPVTMSGAKNALEYSLRDDKFMSSTEAEKLDEMRSREEDGRREAAQHQENNLMKSKDGLAQMVLDLVENKRWDRPDSTSRWIGSCDRATCCELPTSWGTVVSPVRMTLISWLLLSSKLWQMRKMPQL